MAQVGASTGRKTPDTRTAKAEAEVVETPEVQEPELAEATEADVVATAAEAVDEPMPELVEVPKVRYVKYVGASGVTLHQPISTGQRVFLAGKVYPITQYADYVRLTEGSIHFVEAPDPNAGS